MWLIMPTSSCLLDLFQVSDPNQKTNIIQQPYKLMPGTVRVRQENMDFSTCTGRIASLKREHVSLMPSITNAKDQQTH